MLPSRLQDAERRAATRHGRYALYLVGGVFTALALVSDLVPAVALLVPDSMVKASALIAIVFLGLGRFGSDRLVIRATNVLMILRRKAPP